MSLKPKNYPTDLLIWDIFFDLTQTPRPSKKETKIQEYLIRLANKHNLKSITDSVGNIIIYVDGKNGLEKNDPLLIQGHIDMVTDSSPGHKINFETDPLEIFVEGGWVKAKNTTLGADNGIGVAAALALALDPKTAHPPLELLFTIDEETGLHGAKNIDPKYFKSKKMLNLDTEEWGSLYIGCAGGVDFEFTGDLVFIDSDPDYVSFDFTVSGLKGGHSGIDIHRQRGNAIKIANAVLKEFEKELDFEIAKVQGGRAHNIIPREASFVINMLPMDADLLNEVARRVIDQLKKTLPVEDQGLTFKITELDKKINQVLEWEHAQNVLDLLTLMPHGAKTFNWDALSSGQNVNDILVSSSNNLAVIHVTDGKLYLESSVRFTDSSEVLFFDQTFISLAELFSLKLEKAVGYPSWRPDFSGKILEISKNKFSECFGFIPHVKAIHAGLECGIIKEKFNEMDIVSFGPNITGAHSPTESLEIESTVKFWNYLVELVKVI